jgi:hypothetical protein
VDLGILRWGVRLVDLGVDVSKLCHAVAGSTYSITEDGDLVARVHLKLGINIEFRHCVSRGDVS